MFSPAYKRYVLLTLTSVYTLHYADRHLLGVMLQSIKEDLQLSDTQLGFLSGIAFALFYAVCGIPIARWADRGDRVTITSIAIAMWGGMVMLCGLVGNFFQLVLARIGAAVGEAGCMPPTYSLVGDYFHGREHTRAMSIYMMAGAISGIVGFALGGWLNQAYGWRTSFLLAGMPGLVVGVVVKLTVSEPRVRARGPLAGGDAPLPIRDVFMALWQQKSFRHLAIALTFAGILGLGFPPWFAAFLIRSHGMTSGEVGLWLGVIITLAGAVGVLSGGYLFERYLSGRENAWMRVMAVTTTLNIPIIAILVLAPQRSLALLALGALVLMYNIFIGPVFALMQRLVVNELRATALAVVMLVSNLIGLGLGPQVIGIVSDLWRPVLGADSLGLAMLTVSFGLLGSGYYFWIASRTVKEDLSEIQARNNSRHRPAVGEAFPGKDVALRGTIQKS